MRVVGGAKTEEAEGWCVFPSRSFVIFLVWYGYGMAWYGMVCLLIGFVLPLIAGRCAS